ncbi:hypothetical protein ACIQB5_23885 [Streptomyces sp. NPDC088560]|uniref:hypothetical protein n=1 Tax=Streptomyces sp. NPDC088560 TaxID=3365868 RepID=UPI0037F9CBF2
MAFDDAGAPGQGQASGDGGEVPFEAVGEGVEAGQVVGADRFDPLRKPVAFEVGEHPPECADVGGEGCQFRAVREDVFSS